MQHDQDERLRRFYVDGSTLRMGASYTLDGDEGKHAIKVLRCKVGDCVELADGRGNLIAAEICSVDRNKAAVFPIIQLTLLRPWLPFSKLN